MLLIKNNLIGLPRSVLIDAVWQQEDCSCEGSSQNQCKNVESPLIMGELENSGAYDRAEEKTKAD